jgi:hypothetical protein
MSSTLWAPAADSAVPPPPAASPEPNPFGGAVEAVTTVQGVARAMETVVRQPTDGSLQDAAKAVTTAVGALGGAFPVAEPGTSTSEWQSKWIVQAVATVLLILNLTGAFRTTVTTQEAVGAALVGLVALAESSYHLCRGVRKRGTSG